MQNRCVGPASHGRLETVDFGASHLVNLLGLDRIPAVHETEAVRMHRGDRRDGENTPINPLVADLGPVRGAPQGDDSPILELEWGQTAQERLGMRHIPNKL